ncbi:hypothetical protein BDC45DRAFT_327482 [Circinella umbellata]|nr:hypothetical protein BDC45DRAFT_327482 [Circinella umbellata]
MDIQRIKDFTEITNPVPVDHVVVISSVKELRAKIGCVGYALLWENDTKSPSFGVQTNLDPRSVYPLLYAMRSAIQSCQDTDNLNIIISDGAVCNYLEDQALKRGVDTNECQAIKEELKDMISKRTGTTQISGKKSELQKEAKFLAKIACQNELENQPNEDDQIARISSYDVHTRSSQNVIDRFSNPIRKPQIMDTLHKFEPKKNTTVDKNEFDIMEDYVSLDTTGRTGKKRAPCRQEVEPEQNLDENSLVQSTRPLRYVVENRIRSTEWKNEKNQFLRLNKNIKYDTEQNLFAEDFKLQNILLDYENKKRTQNKKRRVENIAFRYRELQKRSQITPGSSSAAPLSTSRVCQTNDISSSSEETDKVPANWIQSLARWFKK